ncbi:hypothetical protein IWQ61_009152 [Dispira simplex]|nr:hypothetical protein IWQ61_009152 [Dispira simplex]
MLPSRPQNLQCDDYSCTWSSRNSDPSDQGTLTASQAPSAVGPTQSYSSVEETYRQLPKFLAEFLPVIVDSRYRFVPGRRLQGKLIAVYFSATWCHPCQMFSPRLADFSRVHQNEVMVIVVSLDHREQALRSYLKKYPGWYAVPFKYRSAYLQLAERLEIQNVPTLLICDSQTGRPITACGVEAVQKNPRECLALWREGKSGVRWWHWFKCW